MARVCLDLSPTVHQHAGLGRYAQELLLALATADRQNEYVVFYNNPAAARVEPSLERFPKITTPLSYKPWRLSALLAHFTRIPQDPLLPGVDLFHATDHLLPYFRRIKSVFTLHDLIFLFHPETHKSLNRWFLTLMMPRFLRAADAVIAVSECTKRDAIRFYRIPEEKITVIYEGVNPRFRPASPEAIAAVRARYGLPERFILYVGTIEPRKNLTTLLEAFHHLLATYDLRLVIVGKKGWLYERFFRRLRELGLEGQVIFTGYVPDEDLPAIYSAADLFVFPSLYEGFGLPVLEAMACGAPVVCSNTSSLPEVAGDAALLVDPTDARALTGAMEQVLTNERLWATLRAKGMERARGFTWEKAAYRTWEVYQQVISSFSGPRRDKPSGDNSGSL
jgi:glycosyltransferase involved in cell wall biosynthesis